MVLIRPVLQHVGGAGVPEHVAGARACQSRLLQPGRNHARHHVGIERLAVAGQTHFAFGAKLGRDGMTAGLCFAAGMTGRSSAGGSSAAGFLFTVCAGHRAFGLIPLVARLARLRQRAVELSNSQIDFDCTVSDQIQFVVAFGKPDGRKLVATNFLLRVHFAVHDVCKRQLTSLPRTRIISHSGSP